MKKKVLALTISTTLTNDQVERSKVRLTVYPDPEGDPHGVTADARNVRVLDSDEIVTPKPNAVAAVREALALMNSMILSGEEHSDRSKSTFVAAKAALLRLGH